MMVLGLTGSIGMGKSVLARQFALLGAKVCNADDMVHSLMAKGGEAVGAVEKEFPGVAKNGAVDRKALGAIVFADVEKRKLLESILHPLVVAAEDAFIKKNRALGARLVVMDIPLLFETGGEKRCDAVVVVTAPPFIQKQRVMKRPHMTPEKFRCIVQSQLCDRDKRLLADFVVQTGLGKAYSMHRLKTILAELHA